MDALAIVTLGRFGAMAGAVLVGLSPLARDPGETTAGTLSGARLITLAALVDSLDELDRNAPVIVYCASGYRSLIAASLLRHVGFADVSDLIGGYGAWTAAVPVADSRSVP